MAAVGSFPALSRRRFRNHHPHHEERETRREEGRDSAPSRSHRRRAKSVDGGAVTRREGRRGASSVLLSSATKSPSCLLPCFAIAAVMEETSSPSCAPPSPSSSACGRDLNGKEPRSSATAESSPPLWVEPSRLWPEEMALPLPECTTATAGVV